MNLLCAQLTDCTAPKRRNVSSLAASSRIVKVGVRLLDWQFGRFDPSLSSTVRLLLHVPWTMKQFARSRTFYIEKNDLQDSLYTLQVIQAKGEDTYEEAVL